jgi:acyl-CoA thioesterase
MKTPEGLRAFVETFVARDRLGALLRARLVSLTPEECHYEYDADPGHHNPNGTLHGGALFTVMDSSQGMLVHSTLEDNHPAAATGTATIKYLAPVRSGRISIRTWITKRDGRKITVASEAFDASGVRVATLEEIWIALRPSA